MAPLPKRPRTDSNASEKEDGYTGAVDLSSPALKPCKELWFDDGNIVVATSTSRYRVHKGILAKQSSAFNDMFNGPGTLGDPSMEGPSVCAASCSEQWEGVPQVKLFGDDDKCVYHFLMALYNRNFFRTHNPSTMTFDIFSSLVNMSIKYDAAEIRAELIGYLSRFYPDTLEAYDSASANPSAGKIFSDYYVGQEFLLLKCAKQCDAHTLLPILSYNCAVFPLETIFSFSHILGWQGVNTIAIGREKMSKWAYEIPTLLFENKDMLCMYDLDCQRGRAGFLKSHMNVSSYDPPLFPLHPYLHRIPLANSLARFRVCWSCQSNFLAELESTRKEFWEDLPDLFNMGTWDEVRERMKTA